MRLRNLIAFGGVILSVAACENPAADKAKASVSNAVAAPTAAPSTAKSVKYVFNNEGSKIGWVGSKVTGKHDGSFETFKGEVSVVDNDPTKSQVTVTIEAASIKADVEKLTGHLKSGDFFDVAKFPEARFVSTAIRPGGDKGATHTVTGNLTMHGITKSISFPATVKVAADAATVDAEFAVNRKDFGLTYPGKADDLIRDDVVLKLTVRASPSK
jgi:polyisoprenoid-binding protein YceI